MNLLEKQYEDHHRLLASCGREIKQMSKIKVPGHLQDRWNRNALRIRRTETREPELLDLTNFIEDEMILVNDPFSREVVGQYDRKKTSEIS